MYAILEFDQMGLKDVDFKRVDYDVQKELQLAKRPPSSLLPSVL